MIVWLALLGTAILVFHAALTRGLSHRRQMMYYGILVVLAASMSSARAAQPVGYDTFAEAAIAGLDEADLLAPDAEAGGTIRYCLGKYYVVDVVTDNDKYQVRFTIAPLAACPLYALFHTHPAGDRRFSVIDINTTCDLKTIGIMRPKGGEIRMFDCRNLANAAVSMLTTNTARPIYGEPLK